MAFQVRAQGTILDPWLEWVDSSMLIGQSGHIPSHELSPAYFGSQPVVATQVLTVFVVAGVSNHYDTNEVNVHFIQFIHRFRGPKIL